MVSELNRCHSKLRRVGNQYVFNEENSLSGVDFIVSKVRTFAVSPDLKVHVLHVSIDISNPQKTNLA